MKAIFLCEAPQKIASAYSEEAVAALRALTDLSPEIFKKEDLLRQPQRFTDVELIFSTWGMPPFSEAELAACLPSLKAVFYAAGSVQGFARPFLARGARVFSAWAANAVPVAEMTVSEIILANKGYYLTSRLFREQGFRAARAAFGQIPGSYGETVGIIGAGMIGRLVIRMLKQYRLRVIVFDPFLSDEAAAELGVTKCSLPELFERAFTVSNHLANNKETEGMLDYDCFRRMREGAVFINTGRGAQVVEGDLVRILRERPDLTALLDVTYPEPPDEGHPFYTLSNCLLTPHIAGSAGDEVARMGEYMADECKAYLSSKPCRYEVTEAMLATMA